MGEGISGLECGDWGWGLGGGCSKRGCGARGKCWEDEVGCGEMGCSEVSV